MNWKRQLQISDLAPEQKLEMTCRRCGHVHYHTRETLLALQARPSLYLDEVEHRASCKGRDCRGGIRMVLIQNSDTSGFVGGLA